MKCNIQLKNVEYDYSWISQPVRLGCPFCKFQSSHKNRTYHSMKSLLFHLSDQHKYDEVYYPFSIYEVKSLMHAIAKSLELGLLT